MNIDDYNAEELKWSQDPKTVDGYTVSWDESVHEYVIELWIGPNVFQTIPGGPYPHKTAEAAHAHARRLGYRGLM